METLAASPQMCILCFDVLIGTLQKQKIQNSLDNFRREEIHATTCCPLFVTWLKGEDKNLRGCIGTFESSKPLYQVLSRYAVVSALQDDRFEPVSLSEIGDLHVNVSLLTSFEEISDCYDWIVGMHGIEIELKDLYRTFSATFLPEVAKEEGWDQHTTIVYLLDKAGYRQKVSRDLNKQFGNRLKVVRYQSSKFSLSYSSYQEMKNGVI